MPKSSSARSTTALRSNCPVSGTLDVLGDRWTLLVIRDLFFGKKRYGEFLASPEGIPTNILAERLARLEDAGIIASAPYQDNPPRYDYELTAKGLALKPVIGAMANWGLKNIAGTVAPKQMAAMRS